MFRASTLIALVGLVAIPSSPTSAAELEPNPFFKSGAEAEQYFLAKSDLVKNMDDLSVLPLGNGVWRLMVNTDRDESGGSGRYKTVVVGVLADYSALNEKLIGGTGRFVGIDFCKGYYLASFDKTECYAMPQVAPDVRGRATIVVRYLLRSQLPSLLAEVHGEALADHRDGNKADAASASARLVSGALWKLVPISPSNVEAYNDLGFFLAEGGRPQEAATVLEEVIRAVPDRTVAYLNLGDAYAGLHDSPKARAAYLEYEKRMEAAGTASKIPKRVTAALQQP
jgi:hypothetical protein